MRIVLSVVSEILETKYTRGTIKSIISDNQNQFDKSKDTAIEIEDYNYLKTTVENIDDYDDKFVVFYSDRHELSFVFEKDKSFTLFEFAKLSIDCSAIPTSTFSEMVGEIAKQEAMHPTSVVVQFNLYRESIIEHQKQTLKKTYPNDPCPCGKTKDDKPVKFKYCCGRVPQLKDK